MGKNSFEDADLHTPAHDAIMVWLEENAAAIVRPYCEAFPGFRTDLFRVDTRWEHQHKGRYIDMLVTARWSALEFEHFTMAFEVKPAIRSVGELIRQLRQYECHTNRGVVVWRVAVVSPDDRFRAIIEKQGFVFIKAPQPEYGPQGGLF